MKDCELRLVRDEEVVCGAGGFVLRRPGEGTERLESICGSCPIPDTVEGHPRACLHLRPIRVARQDGRLDSYFSCHWFYRLNLRRQPTDLLPCQGCPHWFPRPPVDVMTPLGYWPDTERIREAVAHPEEHEIEPMPGWSGWAALQVQPAPRRSRLRRLLDAMLHRRIQAGPGSRDAPRVGDTGARGQGVAPEAGEPRDGGEEPGE